MAILSDIRERIKSDMSIVGTVYDAQIDDAIRSRLRELRGRKFWFLEKAGTLTLLEGQSSVALPTDFATADQFELIVGGMRLSDGHGFDLCDYASLKRDYWKTDPIPTGQPVAHAVFDSRLYASHIADQDYSIPVTYYKKDAAEPGANDTSVWFDDGYDVVRSGAQYIFKRDSQQYTVTEADGDMADMHMRELGRRHERYEAGRM